MSYLVLSALTIVLIIGPCWPELIRYDNYNIYQVKPETSEQLTLLEHLESTSDSLRFLTPITTVGRSVNILVAPHKQPEFLDILKDNGVAQSLIEKDFQKTLDAEQESFKSRSGVYDWNSYHTLEENYEWLRTLVEQYPDKVELIVAGSTYEGREILGVKVSFKPDNKGVFLETGIHAREWIGPATVTYILNQLLTSEDPAIRATAEKFDWYIIPHANPDGYAYTHTRDRLWRKTRSRSLFCYGADPNRNWDFYWNYVGASSFGCSETYAGSSAFSEIETKSLSDYIKSLDGRIHTYIAFHSYSQILLFPYGHTKDHAPNHDDLQQIGDAAAAALAKRYGTKYKVGNIYEAIYPASGASVDWVYGTRDIKVAFTYELRPASSSNGFVLPANQIIPTGLETLDSLMALLGEAEKLNYYV
ncbi:unnamed protein product [Hermetia illucens]|uniref:Zinc carboxypeptidase A 1 n=1 Tax=Hermetia illucens TaxID=343691 RepID=A0A7R8YY20_HERIL|nr:zinc carboxypeptidase-like [Hermetia illucens]CAD7086385.1 unnamed protein product [Hermetia illucens]